jgi:hypothetical protein
MDRTWGERRIVPLSFSIFTIAQSMLENQTPTCFPVGDRIKDPEGEIAVPDFHPFDQFMEPCSGEINFLPITGTEPTATVDAYYNIRPGTPTPVIVSVISENPVG